MLHIPISCIKIVINNYKGRKKNSVISHLAATSDAGCKIDLVISLTNFDA